MTQEKFKHLFIQHFGKGISEEFLLEHVYEDGNFPWHIFSFEQIDKEDYLEGQDAIDAFNKIDKRNAIVFLPFEKKIIMEIHQFDSFEKVATKQEIYVYDKDFKWCFMKTHESDCGPYFISKEIMSNLK